MEIMKVVNKARTNPSWMKSVLEEGLSKIKSQDGNFFYLGEDGIMIMMNEGPSAYIEAIEFLKTQEPLGAVEWCDGLMQGCRDHANDIGPKGIM
jgi:hypothetical protein